MTGLELIRSSDITAEQITTVISGHCPPVIPADCDRIACRDCWLSWLTQEQPLKEQMICHIIRAKRDVKPLVPQGLF